MIVGLKIMAELSKNTIKNPSELTEEDLLSVGLTKEDVEYINGPLKKGLWGQTLEYTDAVECFKRKLSDTNAFILEKGVVSSTVALMKPEKLDDTLDKIDLPFQTCFFEEIDTLFVIKDSPLIPNLEIKSVFVHEHEPRKYTYVMIAYLPGTRSYLADGFLIGGTILADDAKEDFNSWNINGAKLIRILTTAIHSSKLGKESHRPFIKMGTGKHKKTVRPNMVIRVASKKDYEKAVPLGGTIDWQSRWEVRGHWREISGIGKNRSGEYCVQNWTWVIPHIRGPEDKLVVKKPRLITGPLIERRGPEESHGML